MIDVHNYKKKAERAISNLEKLKICKANGKHIKEFYRHCLLDGIGYGKISRYTEDLQKIALFLKKDFDKCKKEDIEKLFIAFEERDYTEWTKYGYRVLIRKFFTWLKGTEERPPEVKWIKLRQKNGNHKLPEELLTEEEIKKLIECAERSRDKAFISLLYESGCRISEILTLRIKNLEFDEYGARITVFGKTGSRRIRSVSSVVYLQSWLNEHPNKDDPEAFVWIKKNTRDELIGYGRMRILIGRIAKKAGVKKKVNPHSFRHARASYLANHLTEAQLKEVFGWTQASKMASIYVHLSGRNTDEAILKLHGKKLNKREDQEEILKPKDCPRCNTQNEPTNKFCKLCGFVLDKEAQQDIIRKDIERKDLDVILNNLMKDKDVLALLAEKIKSNQLISSFSS